MVIALLIELLFYGWLK